MPGKRLNRSDRGGRGTNRATGRVLGANARPPPVVSQTEWDAALAALTEREETVSAAMHELAAARKRMPMVRVEHDYSFEGQTGSGRCPSCYQADQNETTHDRPLGMGTRTVSRTTPRTATVLLS
jgi:hypothetical protein